MAEEVTKWVCKMVGDKFTMIPITGSTPRASKAPAIHGDHIDDTYCHATCKTYDSKSRMNREAKAAGYINIGNDVIPDKKQEYCDKALEREIADIVREF